MTTTMTNPNDPIAFPWLEEEPLSTRFGGTNSDELVAAYLRDKEDETEAGERVSGSVAESSQRDSGEVFSYPSQ